MAWPSHGTAQDQGVGASPSPQQRTTTPPPALGPSDAADLNAIERTEGEHARSLPETPPRANQAILVTSQGAFTFSIEIADDPIERARGLMFRQSMPQRNGMLFDFVAEAPRAFWMKNTPLPLDIIFIKANGIVDSIAHDTTPFSTESIPSVGEARFVLEVNAGVADEIDLAVGDRLLHTRVTQ